MPPVRDVLGAGQPRERRHGKGKKNGAIRVPVPPAMSVFVDADELEALISSAPASKQTALYVTNGELYVYVYPEIETGVALTRIKCLVSARTPTGGYESLGFVCPICKSTVTLSIEPCPHCMHRTTSRKVVAATWL